MSKLIKDYITKNRNCFIFLLIFFFAGTAAGAYYTRNFDSSVMKYMEEFFSAASNIYKLSEPSFPNVLRTALSDSCKTAVFIWLMGFTVIGIGAIILSVLKSGFMCGFLSGFLINLYGGKGLLCAAVIIMAKCFFYIPAILFISCESIKFSSMLIKITGGKFKYRVNFRQCVLSYVLVLAVAVVVMVVYAFFEAYAGGNILKVYLKS